MNRLVYGLDYYRAFLDELILNTPSINLSHLTQPQNSADFQCEVKALAHACSEWGFAYLVSTQSLERYAGGLKACRAFFNQSIEEKMLLATQHYRPTNTNRYRGYFPIVKGSHTYKEGFEVGWQHYQKTGAPYIFDELSVWPKDAPYPGWEANLKHYFDAQLAIGRCLLRAFEVYFNLRQGWLSEQFENTLSTLRLLHYPALDKRMDTSGLEYNAEVFYTTPDHTDSGILTLLLQDGSGGLEVRHSSGCWIEVPPIPGTLVMNIGDLLEHWTGGVFKATAHRVKAPNHSRYSVPFFFEPGPEAIIQAFNQKNRSAPIVYQSYLADKLSSFVEYQSNAKLV